MLSENTKKRELLQLGLRWVKIAKRDRIITGKKQENHENKL